MNLKETTTKIRSQLLAKWPIYLAVGVILAVAFYWGLRPKKVEASGSLYTVRRGDFLISVVEGGTLQAVNEVSIRNEVEGTSRIIYIVPEGSYVKMGDLLVELDSSTAQDQVNSQLINVEKAQFAYIQAQEQLEIQKSVVESEIRAAELKLKFAQMDLDKFIKGEALQELRKAENDITSIQEKLAIDEEKANWSEKLEKQGFETKSNLDRDKLTVMQSKLNYQLATNTIWMLKEFDLPKKRETYESAVHEAEKELARVKHQGTRKLAQYEADLRTQKITLDLSKSKLERDQRNLAAGKIYAPQDGLVVYSVSENRFSSESLIEEGATVRNRQVLIKLPDVSEMKLSIKIHESHINMIQPGQQAFVVLDSMPDQRFRGVVSKVGLLPDTTSRWGNPNLKVYATEILVRDHMPDVKPGVSARAEVIVTNLHNVISVPLQAVTTKQGKQVVYTANAGEPTPVNVQVGMYNTKFIEITDGLREGDMILLSPPLDTHQKDLGGAIVADGEQVAATNLLVSMPTPAANDGINSTNQNGAPTPRARPNFEELRKQFDKNGDGQLDDEERQAMRSAFSGRSPGGAQGRPRLESGGSEDPAKGERPRGRGGENRRNRQAPPPES